VKIIGDQDGVQAFVAVEDDKEVHGTLQDCTPIAEHAKARQALGDYGSKDMRLAASLPAVAVETYMNLNGIDLAEFLQNPVHVRRMCNDPALRDFRIWPGRV
jgi:hypothetical protein